MTNNNTEKTEYQKLRKKLDDKDFARKFFNDKEAEAKELIESILSITLGWDVLTESGNEWGHKTIFRVLDLFTIRHKHFDRAQLAENLQTHIFHFTIKHDDTFREWSKPFEVDLYSDGEDTEQIQETVTAESDAPEPADGKPFSKEYLELATRHSHKVWAEKLHHVFESELVSGDIKNTLQDIFITAAGEANIGIDEPELIKASFPLVMDSLNNEYRTGIMHSIQSIIETAAPESVVNELRQYEKHAITGKTFDEEEAERKGKQ